MPFLKCQTQFCHKFVLPLLQIQVLPYHRCTDFFLSRSRPPKKESKCKLRIFRYYFGPNVILRFQFKNYAFSRNRGIMHVIYMVQTQLVSLIQSLLQFQNLFSGVYGTKNPFGRGEHNTLVSLYAYIEKHILREVCN